jgi:REP-associated tyrosine transposase
VSIDDLDGWYNRCRCEDMPYFYPKHLDSFNYKGRYSYALAFITEQREPLMRDVEVIRLVVPQFVRAGREKGFVVVVHCMMPDHAHLIVDGLRDDSDGLAFIKAAKQYTGYYYKQAYGRRLWQRYGYEHVIRDDMERALTIRYLLANPVRAGIVADPRYFVGLGSEKYTIDELIQISEYTSAYMLD